MMVVRRHIAMLVVVVIIVMALRVVQRLGFAVAHHHRLDHLAQRVLRQRQVASQEARQPREHQGLHGKPVVALRDLRLLAVANAAAERIEEQLVEILIEIGWLLRRRLRDQPATPAVIALADDGNELTAVRALQLGAVD